MAVLRTENLTKQYPGCLALDAVSISFDSGRVHALLGKNGSGKSTLVKCFAGVVQPTSGKMYLNDKEFQFSNPSEAYSSGMAVVYQEMSLVPGLTVAENIFLGRMPKNGRMIDWNTAHREAKLLLSRLNVEIDTRQIVSRLPMWQCQVVEIAKALSYNPVVLMLDEPTSALASHEVSSLFAAIQELKKQDVIIIYISHKLHEIPKIADTVTVLRDGKLIGTSNIGDIDDRGIIHMMFGDVEISRRPDDLPVYDDVVLEVRNLTRTGKFEDISFKLRKGEVFGIAGMLGSGRTELLKSIFGADPYTSGEIYVNGKKAPRRSSPVTMKALGLGLTPEDRKLEGLILIHSIKDNLTYASLKRIANGWVENKQNRQHAADKQVRDLEIKVPDMRNSVNSLSGGNQQKVVVGNWLNNEPQIMLYDEPSRGIDVAAKQQIFEIMWNQSRKGVSTIFVSSELEELLSVCHRIIVIQNGRITGEIMADEVNIEELYTMCMEVAE